MLTDLKGRVKYKRPSENFYFSLNTFKILFLKTKKIKGKNHERHNSEIKFFILMKLYFISLGN